MNRTEFFYPEDAKKQIQELEREISKIKKATRRKRAIPVERGDKIAEQCGYGVNYQTLNGHVRWLSMIVIPDIYRKCHRKVQMRSETELTDEEIDIVRNCANEIYDVVEKYMKEARSNAE